ncbi:MAG: cation diffusion facilitator family transporter [Lachnospiraceae bacterium]|nr:cation diffusion facilitator family transporter [Lachnospiraceae bacterium]
MQTVKDESNRKKIIIHTSILGILANVFLAGFKAVIGILSHSIAIVLDAVNNISDASASLITIIGTKLAGKEPDRKHPFGHGRIEYLSAMVISILVMYAGITSLVESVKKIIHPDTPDYSTVALVIVAVGVLVKFFLGRYVKSVGEKVNSDSLVNSGSDATMDSVISASTLVAALLYLWKGISLEAWLGAIISVIIIKAGVEMLQETISKVLGERAEPELVQQIKKTTCSFPEVLGAYDLVLHNYGPDAFNGSIHIEVLDTYSASELDDLLRRITAAVYEKHNVYLTAIGVYSTNTKDPKAVEMRNNISHLAFQEPYVLQIHGFYVNFEKKLVRFDAVISFDAPSRRAVYESLLQKMQQAYPDYTFEIAMDIDFTET